MSSTSATTVRGGRGVMGTLTRIGRSLMLPIAILPAAGLLLRFGQSDMLGSCAEPVSAACGRTEGLGWDGIAEVFAAAGGLFFPTYLPHLFAIGVAVGFAKRADGSTALSALAGYLVFAAVFEEIAEDHPVEVTSGGVTQEVTPSMFVLGGILMGLVTAVLFDRYHRKKLPPYLAFFGGRRFVPILAAFAGLILGALLPWVWFPIGEGIVNAGEWMTENAAIGAGIYGAVNRLLIPFGLHHIPNTLIWFVFGTYTDPSTGETSNGDLARYFAGDPSAGEYMSGFFPIMMFGLPAAALAITLAARPERRAFIGGIMLSAGFTSFLTGITEPIEFAFIFIAPLLFGVHIVLTGVALWISSLLDIKIGFSFSAGFIDYVLNFRKENTENAFLVILLGIVFALVYFFLFRWLIERFNIMTPGREPDEDTGETATDEPAAAQQDAGTSKGETAPATP